MVAGACGGFGRGVESEVSVLGAGAGAGAGAGVAGAADATRGGALVRGRFRGGESLSLPDILRRVEATACNGGVELTGLYAWIAATCCRDCRGLQRSLSQMPSY